MLIGGKKNVAESSIKTATVKREAGPSPLLMYSDAPSGKIEYDEFTNLALDRFSS